MTVAEDSSQRRKWNVFITGTDTGVGKTHVSLALIRGLVRDGRRVAAMKPVAAGAMPAAGPASGTDAAAHTVAIRQSGGLRNDDALLLAAAANVVVPYETLNPYCLGPPVSPHIAAEEAGITIDPVLIRREFDKLARQADCVVVEGAGGWLAPISRTQTMADVALALELPVILVVGLRLGCLNHALLTVRAVRASGLNLVHWIANAIEPQFERSAENLAWLRATLGPPLAVVPHSLHRVDTTIHVSL